jgi:hypothetical protein
VGAVNFIADLFKLIFGAFKLLFETVRVDFRAILTPVFHPILTPPVGV